jgi:hypothetical protein
MIMIFWNPRVWVFPLLLAWMSHCAGKEEKTNCPDLNDPDEEIHLSTAEDGQGLCTMLHIVGRSCPRVGKNRFHLYAGQCREDSGMPMAYPAYGQGGLVPLHTPGTTATLPVTVVEVTGNHIDMGHGLSQPWEQVPDHPDQFFLTFPMAGRYRLEIQYRTSASSSSPLATTHTIEVSP